MGVPPPPPGIPDISLWTNSTLNNILLFGNNLYSTIRNSVQTHDFLLLTDVANTVSIFDKVYSLQYSESFTGSLFMTSNIGPYMSLRNSPLDALSNSQQNYNCCLLTIGINTLTVFKNSEQSFQIFDSRDLYGMPDSCGRHILVHIEGFENVASYLQIPRCCFSWFLKQVPSKNYTIDSGDICLKIQKQKKCQLLDLSPNQLDGLIKIDNKQLTRSQRS